MAYSEQRPQLIAHRGYSACYPENTLIGFEAALRAGADCIEFDVQFSRDGVPIVIHDDDLRRTTDVAARVSQLTAAQLSNIFAGERQRFGDRFKDVPIPTLETILESLSQWPKVTAFVELKIEAIESYGLDSAVKRMVSMLKPFGEQCVLISFHADVPPLARKLGMKRIGWVIRDWDKQSLECAGALAPDVLFCNYKKIPDTDGVLWPGSWHWALYDVVDPEVAMRWIRRGARFIESWDVGGLLSNQELASCFGK